MVSICIFFILVRIVFLFLWSFFFLLFLFVIKFVLLFEILLILILLWGKELFFGWFFFWLLLEMFFLCVFFCCLLFICFFCFFFCLIDLFLLYELYLVILFNGNMFGYGNCIFLLYKVFNGLKVDDKILRILFLCFFVFEFVFFNVMGVVIIFW